MARKPAKAAPASRGRQKKPARAGRSAPGANRRASSKNRRDPAMLADSLGRTTRVRQLFWNNVIREILSSLAGLAAQSKGARLPDQPETLPTPYSIIPGITPESGRPAIFDGRLGVITSAGTRIPIADIRPVFSVGVTDNAADRWLSSAVEGTVYEITTPEGEVFTIPLHEIRTFHSLTEELLERLRANARSQSDSDEDQPFGFAAFTSLARSRLDPETAAAPGPHSPMADPGWYGE